MQHSSNPSFTIVEFCADQKISRAMFYKLRQQELAPALIYIGNSPRITQQAIIDWQIKLSAERLNVEKGND